VALGRARQLLGKGQSVIVDGTWRDPHVRAHAHYVATETLSALVELRCVATNDTAAERITTRRRGNSDVTPEIAAALASRNTGWDTAYSVDTSGSLEASVVAAQDVWCQAIYAPGMRITARPD
jgi:predicted kinase